MSTAEDLRAAATERGLLIRSIDFAFEPAGDVVPDLFIEKSPASGVGPILHVQFSPVGRVMAAYILRGPKTNRTRIAISGPAYTGPRAGKRAVFKVLDLLAKGLL